MEKAQSVLNLAHLGLSWERPNFTLVTPDLPGAPHQIRHAFRYPVLRMSVLRVMATNLWLRIYDESNPEVTTCGYFHA